MTDPADLFTDPAERARILAEAQFGLDQIGPLIAALPAGARVLEVGCGTGFLLARMAAMRPDLGFTGLEPIGPGFAAFADTLARIKAAQTNVAIYHDGIETFSDARGFDLVFSVNVFEHVADWRQAVDNGMALLVTGGRKVILCPNYAIPYEPHFRIPIIGTPALTRRLFSRSIARIEAQSPGLWQSLNFISLPALRRHCRQNGHDIRFDANILPDMLLRLDTDPEFAQRQARIAGVARLLNRIGIVALLRRLPPVASPYMKAVLTRRSDRPR
ncbi:class I SAM-dependent methyltransferase [Paragemmobacter straminiformis]|uniref:Class I SAM-dependent methyltransferase n=1 Tax=Paragemmobacter straminiformis TaxID=2045119 RepID=A0A842IBC0_9RHOB|nr:class I SAM-dependent methyltransferase [Gemmobacter straminiformis]MBC2836288.1 class I SAM-dependent methyltransferase [Gemmobacter straminiformis]